MSEENPYHVSKSPLNPLFFYNNAVWFSENRVTR